MFFYQIKNLTQANSVILSEAKNLKVNKYVTQNWFQSFCPNAPARDFETSLEWLLHTTLSKGRERNCLWANGEKKQFRERVFLFSSSPLLNPQPYGTQFHTTQLRFVGSASVPRRGRNFKEILRNNLRACINIPTTNSSEWRILRNLLTSLSFWAKRRIQLIFIGWLMIFYDIKKLFTFSFLFRRKKKKQNRKRKTRMTKWLESSGALPPNPLSKFVILSSISS